MLDGYLDKMIKSNHTGRFMNCKAVLAVTAIMMASISLVNAQEGFLFRFDKPNSARPWQTVNDGVMGGRSDGRFGGQITHGKNWIDSRDRYFNTPIHPSL